MRVQTGGPLVRGARRTGSFALAFFFASARASAAEPWVDPDPPEPPSRYPIGDLGFRGAAEYRAQGLYIDPISVASPSGRYVSWIDQRLRLDATGDWRDTVKIVTSFDVLDGVLWGDNGTLGVDPQPNAGANANVRNPSLATACIGYRGGDPLVADSYGYTLCPATPIFVRKAYGEVALPFGVLRVGRQNVNIGMGVQAADGEGRQNRFGISKAGSLVDRVLFATKPLEALKPEWERDKSDTNGLIVAIAYDRWVSDYPQSMRDDVHQLDLAFRFLQPRHRLGSDLLVSGYYARRWDLQYGTKINTLGTRVTTKLGDFHVGFDGAMNLGSTREVSEAYKLITNDPVDDQTVLQAGGRLVGRYDRPLWSAYLEMDYASGDGDPTARTPLTQFVWAEDTNVGLLLFKHVLHYQSARSALAGVELLKRLGATSYPAESINTKGAFTNAFALFPQLDVRPLKNFLVRTGVLFAWAPAPVVSPVASLQARDGLTIRDDLVNFAGGRPGSHYGTEFDLRVQYRFLDHFILDVEGATFVPGSALQDADGYAARSTLVQGRTTFFF
jgi:hypothetical protein